MNLQYKILTSFNLVNSRVSRNYEYLKVSVRLPIYTSGYTCFTSVFVSAV